VWTNSAELIILNGRINGDCTLHPWGHFILGLEIALEQFWRESIGETSGSSLVSTITLNTAVSHFTCLFLGLDPAGPLFGENVIPDLRLHKNHARCVKVIHSDVGRIQTSTFGTSEWGFGINYNAGHMDFYPNWGKLQPQCSSWIPGKDFLSK